MEFLTSKISSTLIAEKRTESGESVSSRRLTFMQQESEGRLRDVSHDFLTREE